MFHCHVRSTFPSSSRRRSNRPAAAAAAASSVSSFPFHLSVVVVEKCISSVLEDFGDFGDFVGCSCVTRNVNDTAALHHAPTRPTNRPQSTVPSTYTLSALWIRTPNSHPLHALLYHQAHERSPLTTTTHHNVPFLTISAIRPSIPTFTPTFKSTD